MTVCSRGHEVDEGARFCPECGEPIGADIAGYYRHRATPSTLFADALFFFLGVIAIACLVMFVWALIGSGEVNGRDEFKTYAYISGLGAAPWLFAALLSVSLASWRASRLMED